MEVIGWVLLVVVLLCLVAWRLTYTAARLDRLHARVEGSMSALDAQLVRRAEATLELVRSEALEPMQALTLGAIATESLELADVEEIASEVRRHGLSPNRSAVESELSVALADVLTPDELERIFDSSGPGADCLEMVGRASQRVELSRRFYNDAVRDVRTVRAKPSVRWFHLAGHTELPEMVEFNDDVPQIRRP